MSLDTLTKSTDTPAHSMGPMSAWLGFDAEAAAKFAAPLQAYPQAIVAAYSAWLEAGSEPVMNGIAANQLVLGLCRDCWSNPQQQSGAALPTAMLDATRKAMTRQTEIVTSLPQRLIGCWAPVRPNDLAQVAQRNDAAGTVAQAGARSARVTPPAQRDTLVAGTRP